MLEASLGFIARLGLKREQIPKYMLESVWVRLSFLIFLNYFLFQGGICEVSLGCSVFCLTLLYDVVLEQILS